MLTFLSKQKRKLKSADTFICRPWRFIGNENTTYHICLIEHLRYISERSDSESHILAIYIVIHKLNLISTRRCSVEWSNEIFLFVFSILNSFIHVRWRIEFRSIGWRNVFMALLTTLPLHFSCARQNFSCIYKIIVYSIFF